LLVQSGADPNGTSGVNGWTVLMHAIHKSARAAVSALLQNRADPNQPGTQGGTPLTMAAGYGQTGAIQDLLNHGANPKQPDRNGRTPLECAITGTTDIDDWTAGKCQTEAVRLLVEAAPDMITAEFRKRVSRETSRCPAVASLLEQFSAASRR